MSGSGKCPGARHHTSPRVWPRLCANLGSPSPTPPAVPPASGERYASLFSRPPLAPPNPPSVALSSPFQRCHHPNQKPTVLRPRETTPSCPDIKGDGSVPRSMAINHTEAHSWMPLRAAHPRNPSILQDIQLKTRRAGGHERVLPIASRLPDKQRDFGPQVSSQPPHKFAPAHSGGRLAGQGMSTARPRLPAHQWPSPRWGALVGVVSFGR